MTEAKQKLTLDVIARRIDAHGSMATCKSATIRLDTDLAGNPDALNPAELLLAALAACMIKGIERVQPMLKFQLEGVEVHVHGVRQDQGRPAWAGNAWRNTTGCFGSSARSAPRPGMRVGLPSKAMVI